MSLDLHGLEQIEKLCLSFGLFIATPLGLNDLIFISGFFFPIDEWICWGFSYGRLLHVSSRCVLGLVVCVLFGSDNLSLIRPLRKCLNKKQFPQCIMFKSLSDEASLEVIHVSKELPPFLYQLK